MIAGGKGMSKRSDKLVDIFFDDVPYGEETMRAKARVRARLAEMAEKLPFSSLAENYHSLEKLAVLAGYTPEDAHRWESTEDVLDAKATVAAFRSCRWVAYLTAALCCLTFTALLWAILYGVARENYFFAVLTLFLLGSGCVTLLVIAFSKKVKKRSGAKIAAEGYIYLRTASDKYVKRLLNACALFTAAVFVFEMTELDFYIFGNSKVAELIESMLTNYLLVAIPLFFLIKNAMLLWAVRKWTNIPDGRRFRTHLFGVIIFSVAYWSVSMLAMVFFRQGIAYPADYVLYASIVFVFCILLYDVTFRKTLCYRNFVLNKVRLSAVLVAVLLCLAFLGMNRDTWYTQPYINALARVAHTPSSIVYNEETGVYTITPAAESFKILHLTDIHLGGSLFSRKKDLLALQACYREIAYSKPDLVIVTGDLCFPMGVMSLSFNNSAPVQQFAAFMRNVGIPWAFTFGNHDTESLASMKKDDLVEVYKSLSFKTSGNLLFPYVQPNITGRNNQLIEVRNRDDSLLTALFLIDSNAYLGGGLSSYDYIRDDQVEWYAGEVRRLQAEEGRQISSLAFFHIPLQQYRTAYELYLAGSEEVTYHFGENNESFREQFSCSEYDSAIFETMVSLGSTTGTFCGHDHYNNASITYRGIRLTYGMSIDYLAMPGIAKDTAQRGAELVTIYQDASWDVVQIPLVSITE